MKLSVLAILVTAIAIPVAAQTATPSVPSRTAAVSTPASPKAVEKTTTPRESARVAKAQNKDLRCATKEKQPRQKKPTAT